MSGVIITQNIADALENILVAEGYSSIFLLTDEAVAENCLKLLPVNFIKQENIFVISSGEESKSLSVCEGIWSWLLEANADRRSLLINLGGGMVTDLGGFVASTYKRGIPFLHIPTTLLGMVDAAIGGKTGINFGPYKNQIGTFAEPVAVIIDMVFLRTLPERHLLAGFAEVCKYGLIADHHLWKLLSAQHPRMITDWEPYIRICDKLKEDVVNTDPLEKGARKLLNFGHTVGHALESFSLKESPSPLLHGEAVAIGIIAESYLSFKRGMLNIETMNSISSYISKVYQKYFFPEQAIPFILSIMEKDKKNTAGRKSFVMLKEIGQAVWDQHAADEEIAEALKFYLNL